MLQWLVAFERERLLEAEEWKAAEHMMLTEETMEDLENGSQVKYVATKPLGGNKRVGRLL